MITKYKVWIYKNEECSDCGHRTMREAIFMQIIPNKETAQEIVKLLEQHLDK